MSLTPLQQPQNASLPGIAAPLQAPPPMQPVSGPSLQPAPLPPWHDHVVQNFQQAHGTFDGLAADLQQGNVPMQAHAGSYPHGGGGGGGNTTVYDTTPQGDSPSQSYGPQNQPFDEYGQARGGSAYLAGQPWGQQGNPAPADPNVQDSPARFGDGPGQPDLQLQIQRDQFNQIMDPQQQPEGVAPSGWVSDPSITTISYPQGYAPYTDAAPSGGGEE